MRLRVNSRNSAFAALCFLAFGLSMMLPPGAAQLAQAQPPSPSQTPTGPFNRPPDPRVEQRSYHFEETDEELPYAVFVSSRVSADTPSPLIIALHGLGGDHNSLLRSPALDLAEDGGYILVGPMGYNSSGWYGSPVIVFGDQPVDPPNLAELSERDVMNVLAMVREEFNVDDDRIYLMGHSMGGAGVLFLGQKYASTWAAVAAIAPAAFMMQQNREAILAPVKDASVPVMIIQGSEDTVVPTANTRVWAESLRELGLTHEYIEIEGGDHGDVIGLGMPDIFALFDEQRRHHAH